MCSSMPSYTGAQAREAIAASRSYAEASRRLGRCWTGGASNALRKWAAIWDIPTDHFDPYRSSRGLQRRTARPLDEVLVVDSVYNRGRLKERLYESGLKHRRCELCGQGERWRGQPMSLILDHVNGIATDNRLENLRIVCPNCAATLDTHCGRKLRLEPRDCLLCGRSFVPSTSKQRYCSRTCGQRRTKTADVRGAPQEAQGRATNPRAAPGRLDHDELRGGRPQVRRQRQRGSQVAALVSTGGVERSSLSLVTAATLTDPWPSPSRS